MPYNYPLFDLPKLELRLESSSRSLYTIDVIMFLSFFMCSIYVVTSGSENENEKDVHWELFYALQSTFLLFSQINLTNHEVENVTSLALKWIAKT